MFQNYQVLSIVAASVLGVASASAADLKPIYKAIPAPILNSWTGYYFGAHAGYGTGKKIFVDNFPVYDGEIDGTPKIKGGLAGLQAGYNYQVNRWLLVGTEGDFSWSKMNSKDFSCFTFGDQICSANAEWLATLTARIGVIMGPTMIYAKGGGAWVHDRYTDIARTRAFRGGVFSDPGVLYTGSDTRSGWTYGLGVEYRINANWSLKAEYSHMDFGKRSVPFEGESGLFFTEEIHQKTDVVKIGFNYLLNPMQGGPSNAYALSMGVAPDDEAGKVEVFTGVDASRRLVGGWAGALIALSKDTDTSGGRVYLAGGAGRYNYPTNPGSIRGTYADGDILAGYSFEGDNYSISLLGGINLINHTLSEPDSTNQVQGTKAGAKVRAWLCRSV